MELSVTVGFPLWVSWDLEKSLGSMRVAQNTISRQLK